MNKKELKELIKREYPFIIYKEKDTDYYVLDFIDIENCYVVGETIEEVLKYKDKIKEGFLEGYYEIFGEIPEPTDFSDVSGKFTIRLPKTLISKLKNIAKIEGISINQLLLYIVSDKKLEIPYRFDIFINDNYNEIKNNMLLRIPKTLHHKLKLIAKSEGVSLNQYLIYKITEYINNMEKTGVISFKEDFKIPKDDIISYKRGPYEYKAG